MTRVGWEHELFGRGAGFSVKAGGEASLTRTITRSRRVTYTSFDKEVRTPCGACDEDVLTGQVKELHCWQSRSGVHC